MSLKWVSFSYSKKLPLYQDLDGDPSSLPIIFEDIYGEGVPKRSSICDNLQLSRGCLLVPTLQQR